VIPDAHKVVADHVRTYPSVSTLQARVVNKTPDTLDKPWVRVSLLDAPSNGVPDYLIAALVQFDCYAAKDGQQNDGAPGAMRLALAVRESLTGDDDGIARATHADAVVSGARINSFGELPDSEMEPARARVVITSTIWLHR